MIYSAVLVSGVQPGQSVTRTHTSTLFLILFPFRLLQNTEENSLCYTVSPCWLFFLYTLLRLSRFSRVRLCDPIDGSPPGSPVHGILQARTLEWVAISFSSFPLKLEEVTVQYTQAKSYPTLCDPMDCSPPGSSVHGIL